MSVVQNHAEAIMDMVKDQKIRLVAREGRQDLPPSLFVVKHDGEVMGGALTLTCDHDHDPPTLVRAAIEVIRSEGRPRELTLIVEGYFDTRGGTSNLPQRRGMIEFDFLHNPATTVREALIVTVLADNPPHTVETYQIIQPFGYDDAVQVVWYDPHTHYDDGTGGTERIEGRIQEVMLTAFEVLP